MAEKFDEATQKELQKFLQEEQKRERVQQTVQSLTSACWDKCITGSVSTRFARGEEKCLVNCVGRFLDTSLHMVNRLEANRQAHSSL
ncbi:Tim10/DDP family zinc finger-domain-containing protein [Cantharellus anzutake]|uniref:Tim10/DDP family zinc finger-domain-containing protein n=1 Tax=Cantharellus anzutake TaxID=1750568 RepID=UPI0019075444|nr:Tim10/DDP family zinc finger-domain-containing protein [Cantharellus anzutake]KAF8338169.1 Tim10/DDP family zinc finger-domain-containing protein [Cantharellus anzutake]